MKLAGRKSSLKPRLFILLTMVPVLVLLFVALFHYTRRFALSLVLCYFVLVFSILLTLQLPRLGKRTNVSAFRTFVRFALVWFCLFPLPLRVWDGLQLVVVELTGLFSYLFWDSNH